MFKTRGAHLDRVLHGKARADESGLFAVVPLYGHVGVGVGLIKRGGGTVLGDPCGGAQFRVDAGIARDHQIPFGESQILVDHLHVGGGELIPAADAQDILARLLHALVDLHAGAVAFGVVADDGAVFEFDDTVGVALREIAVVRDDQHQFSFGEFFQGVKHLLARVGVQRARRLVGHDDLRLFHQRARDGDTLLLTARKLVGFAVGVPGEVDL